MSDFARVTHVIERAAGEPSDAAFAHALKIALATRGALTVVHVDNRRDEHGWGDKPSVREALSRWRLIPQGSSTEDVAALGLKVGKIRLRGHDPARTLRGHFTVHPTDLAVIAAPPARRLPPSLSRQVARPLLIATGAPALIVPDGTSGFVSTARGSVTLERVLVPMAEGLPAEPAIAAVTQLLRALACRQVVILLVWIGEARAMPRPELPSDPGWEWRRLPQRGSIVGGIAEAARNFRPELVAVTTAFRRRWSELVRGTTTDRLLHELRCPVLAVPSDAIPSGQ